MPKASYRYCVDNTVWTRLLTILRSARPGIGASKARPWRSFGVANMILAYLSVVMCRDVRLNDGNDVRDEEWRDAKDFMILE